jgi:hypothetical protein
MLGTMVSLFFPQFVATSRCDATHFVGSSAALGIKNQRDEISSLDVGRERAMLLAKKMFRGFAGFVPGRHRLKQDLWGETHEDPRRRRVRS